MPELKLNAAGQLEIDTFYTPLPKQEELHRSSAHNVLAIGGNYSGKSLFLIGEAIYVMAEYPGADCLLLRRDFPELDRGLILDWKNMVPREVYEYNEQKHMVTWLPGSKHPGHLFFGYLASGSEKDLSKYLSSAFVFVGIDELGQFSYQAWSFLSSRNRRNQDCQVSTIDGGWPVPRMAGATNPMGPGYGWIRSCWIDKKPVIDLEETERGEDGKYYQEQKGKKVCVYDPEDYVYVHSTILDNPIALERDPTALTKLERLPPALRAKALDGNLDTLSGTYFTSFTYDRNVRSLPQDREEVIFEEWQPRWLSIDWGLAHWCLTYWHTKARVAERMSMYGEDGKLRPKGEWKWKYRVVTYRELAVHEMDHTAVCDLIGKRTPEEEKGKIKHAFLSPERFARTASVSKAHTIAAEMSDKLAENGLPRCLRANDRRVDGAVFMYNLLDAGDWVILDYCPLLIKALETRVRDEKNLEDVLKVDGDQLDDAYDGARYGLLSMLKEKQKPEELRVAEHAEGIEDRQMRMMYLYEHRLRQEGKAFGVKLKAVPKWMLRR
jgi:hypothetical protein